MQRNSPNSRHVLAFDIGGSHVSCAICEVDQLKIVRTASSPVEGEPSCDEFLDLLGALSSHVLPDSSRASGVVLAVPGPFDFAAGISYMQHKLRALNGFDLRSGLADRFSLPAEEISFVNDAAAFLLGELHSGAARGAMRATAMVVGTGIGCAFIENGKWITGGNGVPPGGEIWNLSYRDGTVEDLLSTRAIKGNYATRAGEDAEVALIAARAGSDPLARAVFEEFGVHLGQIIRDILLPFGPEIVVIGGGISRSAQLFMPFAKSQLNGFGPKLVVSSLLDQAALIGAAAFWKDRSDTREKMKAKSALVR